ncbi:hypothetical protein DPMN_190102 [Dreissena polymorpha]|uniref:Uncharacterized protein n=1 Tax=Dreissena polymorpha TaxID=45954 RepID=A0A9D4DU01_DREPO|nr:hypothetical protein DPMN_190102 [Dreissena polymorpha]
MQTKWKKKTAVLYGHPDVLRQLLEGQEGTRPVPYPLPQRPTPPSIGSFRGFSEWSPQLGSCFRCQHANAQARK